MNTKKKIGLRVKELRLKSNITQQALADSTGLDRTFISHIESGERNIAIETLEKLISGLDISFKSFFASKYFVR